MRLPTMPATIARSTGSLSTTHESWGWDRALDRVQCWFRHTMGDRLRHEMPVAHSCDPLEALSDERHALHPIARTCALGLIREEAVL
jgi:hypothetical protein